MPLTVALLSIAALLGAAGLAVALARSVEATRIIYGLCFGFSLILFVAAVVPRSAAALTAALPLGLPWIGAHFRMDVLSAFFLAIVNLGRGRQPLRDRLWRARKASLSHSAVFPRLSGRHESRAAGRRRIQLSRGLGVHVAFVMGARDGAPS